jgi:(p)ppGpp synthase/HD superfamily hydrolase
MKIPQGRQAHLLGFVTLKHDLQKRKYTNEPYVTHLRAVADMADGKCKLGYEIGLCHDLLEDTDCTDFGLYNALERIGYNKDEACFIVDNVVALTDEYITETYPSLNRRARKSLEAARLHLISPAAQTVKYCDLIHNTESIVAYDRGFALKYIAEKEQILQGMNKGHKLMYKTALQSLHDAKKKLNLI